MAPIGRGQRQLIIGDRQTGKTTVAVDTIINQRENLEVGDPIQAKVRWTYVAMRLARSGLDHRGSRPIQCEESGALEYIMTRCCPASDAAGFQYPCRPTPGLGYQPCPSRCTFRQAHVLVIFDDLIDVTEDWGIYSAVIAAAAPAGRVGEVYPGAVLSCSLAVLERFREVSDKLRSPRRLDDWLADHPDEGEGEVSAFIPTNVISITAGRSILEPTCSCVACARGGRRYLGLSPRPVELRRSRP